MATRTPHNALFTGVFSTPADAAGELRAVVPEPIARQIDWSTLKLCDGHFIDASLAASQTDLLFSATMNGAPCLIYLLFEHQSTVDPLLPLRLLRYMVNVWERWLTEQHNPTSIPPIIPVVLCHADGGWRAASRMRELYAIDSAGFEAIRELVPDFGFVLEDLFVEHDHALMSRHLTALAQVTLLLLKHGRSGDLIEKLVSWAHLLGAVLAAPDGMRRMGHVVSYVLQMTSRATAEQLVEALRPQLGDPIREVVMTEAERLEAIGEARGEARGKAEGKREVLLRQLRRRFGELPEWVATRVEAAGSDELDAWTERILSARDLDEMFG